MAETEVLDRISALEDFRSLCARISSKAADFGSLGLIRAARFPTAAAFYAQLSRPVLYLTDHPERALIAQDEIRFWCPQSDRFFFPAPEPLFYENASWSMAVRHDRIQTLTQLTRFLVPGVDKPEKNPLIVLPVRALMTRTMSRQEFIRATRRLRVGQEVSSTALLREWSRSGYEAAEAVLEPGQFSRRGELLDIWPHSEPYPLRLDLFDRNHPPL